MEKYIAFDLYQKNEQGGHTMAKRTPLTGDEVYLASDVATLVHAARATLTEQRREFARGDVADLDALEDALNALESR